MSGNNEEQRGKGMSEVQTLSMKQEVEMQWKSFS